MVSRFPRGEPLARGIGTLLTALWVGIALLATPFGCAVGEYEEDRDCSVPPLAGIAAAALVAGVVAGRISGRRGLHWGGIGIAVVLAAMALRSV